MISFACYAVYRGADPRLLQFFQKEALRNANIVIGIDIMFIRQSYGKSTVFRSLFSTVLEIWRDLIWYLQMMLRGHIILPLPLLISIVGWWINPKDVLKPPCNTVSLLYSSQWPNATVANEIMATYLRFVATPVESYGLEPYDRRFISLLKRWKTFHILSNFVFKFLRPRIYLSLYSGYLTHWTVCDSAIRHKVPALVLGCSDCLYRISDQEVPRQFDFIHYRLARQPNDFVNLSARGNDILAKRIQGDYDPTLSYMKTSAYAGLSTGRFWNYLNGSDRLQEISNEFLRKSSKDGFITIFMHEFNDWHHNGVLPGFATSYYEWLMVTLAYIHAKRIPYVLKIHPCIVGSPSLYGVSIDALLAIADQLGNCLNVTTSLSTLELINCKMKLGVTVRGTVALELAYLKVPFLCAGRPPYADLFPMRTVTDSSHYQQRLLHFQNEPSVSDAEASLASYYVALQERDAGLPIFNLTTAPPKLADNNSYHRIKSLL
jgi:hypothetical protein